VNAASWLKTNAAIAHMRFRQRDDEGMTRTRKKSMESLMKPSEAGYMTCDAKLHCRPMLASYLILYVPIHFKLYRRPSFDNIPTPTKTFNIPSAN
jgi:hypothetical protein